MCNLKYLAAGLVSSLIFLEMPSESHGQGEPERYALLVGVTEYEKPELNTGLKFPEKDAKALAVVLEQAGYTVDLLLGKQAKKQAITDRLRAFKRRGGNEGVIFVSFSGHGTESTETKKSYFCPHDTVMEAVRDAMGRIIPGPDGKPVFGPELESLVAIDEVLIALGESKASHRIVVADCCRDDPNRAKNLMRGKSFGSSLNTDSLPLNTVMLLGCSTGERSFENDDWGHGALTKCLLAELSTGAVRTMGNVAEDVLPAVEKLVKSKSPSDKQKPRLLNTGRVELLFKQKSVPAIFNFANGPQPESKARAAQQSWADHTGQEVFFTNTLGMQFRFLPPGEFMMGSPESESGHQDDERKHRVRITKPTYVGAHEVTLGQFLMYYNADKANHKTDAEKDGKGGWGYTGSGFEQKPEYLPWNTGWNEPVDQYMEHPVVNVSWNDAMSFCKWLSRKEGRKYRLLTEAEWEYACRAGSTTSFQNGDDSERLVRVGNVADGTAKEKFPDWTSTTTSKDGFVFTSPKGKFGANGFGLYDLHGNVWEWCADNYDADAYKNRGAISVDPSVNFGSARMMRGGGWGRDTVGCRSASRGGYEPDFRILDAGFRVAIGL